MLVACINKQRDTNGKIIKYKLQGRNNSLFELTSDELKNAIRTNQLTVSNLTLTSDNRLVDSDQMQRARDKSKSNYSELDIMIDNMLRQAMMSDIVIRKIPTACNNECYLISKSDVDHMLLIPNSVKQLNKDHTPDSWVFTQYIRTVRGAIQVFGCTGLKDATAMFSHSEAQKIDMFNTDTSNVTNMKAMFCCCKAQYINISRLNTENVTNMVAMFMKCKAQMLDFSNFNTSKVRTMYSMFFGCETSKLDLSSFDTSNVTDMEGMFNGCKTDGLHISSFNTAKVESMSNMFSHAKIPVINILSFDTSKVNNFDSMFSKCMAKGIIIPNLKMKNSAHKNWIFHECRAKLKTNNLFLLKEYHLHKARD